MKVEIRIRAKRDVDAVGDKYFAEEIEEFICDALSCDIETLKARYNFMPLRGDSAYYRLRVDDYRLGCRYDQTNNTLIVMRFLHRADIYKLFSIDCECASHFLQNRI